MVMSSSGPWEYGNMKAGIVMTLNHIDTDNLKNGVRAVLKNTRLSRNLFFTPAAREIFNISSDERAQRNNG